MESTEDYMVLYALYGGRIYLCRKWSVGEAERINCYLLHQNVGSAIKGSSPKKKTTTYLSPLSPCFQHSLALGFKKATYTET